MRIYFYTFLLLSFSSFGQGTVLFNDDFQQGIPGSFSMLDLDLNTPNTQVSEFNAAWIAVVDPENALDTVAAATSFFENPDTANRWLITPAINLDASTAEQLTFKTNVGYYNGDALSVYVSTDFTGNSADIGDATWLAVDATLPQGPTSGYGTTFTNSGPINVSCLEGNMYVAFKYLGSSTGITTTFQVDDVKVTGN